MTSGNYLTKFRQKNASNIYLIFLHVFSPEEIEEFHKRQSVIIDRVLTIPVDELFIIKEIKPDMPEKARIFHSVQCASCGEMVAEHRARVSDGKFVCIPCSGEYNRGWK